MVSLLYKQNLLLLVLVSFFFFFFGSPGLPTHSIVVFFSIVFQLNELEVLKKRIKALEDSSHPSEDNLIVKLKEHSLRKEGDFDKYRAISILGDLVALALQKIAIRLTITRWFWSP